LTHRGCLKRSCDSVSPICSFDEEEILAAVVERANEVSGVGGNDEAHDDERISEQ
jgi:hypothetical protein